MTFAQRIELGKILGDQNLQEFKKFKACLICLAYDGSKDFDESKVDVSYSKENIKYWDSIIEGIYYWIEREKKDLKYVPTPEEYAAGIELLTMDVGEFSTIIAIAEKFAQDPDSVLGWKYQKVFNTLYTNLKTFLFTVRLQKQQAQKYKSKTEQGRRGARR